jgi:hypothetical protein
MMTLWKSGIRSLILLPGLLLLPPSSWAELSKDLNDRLGNAKYVYVSSTRKDGSLGKPAEIWFLYVDGAVYVGTRPASWRVRRIEAGRPRAKIWVGEPSGPSRFTATERELQNLPSFMARGELVKDVKLQEKMFEVYAKKYPEGWGQHESSFRNGFKDGSRVMVRYTPDE